MVLVISRFKVANGLEPEVMEAFGKRPGLVESVPGFLGMEVFTASGDTSMFHLVTRWIDRETFHAWHKSPEHHLSHGILPSGLKLDPAFTQILELHRLSNSPTHQHTLQESIFDSSLLLESFLMSTESVVFCIVDAKGYLQIYNDAMIALLKTTEKELKRTRLWDFLTISDQDRLQRLLDSERYILKERLRLNFVDSLTMPHTFDCLIQRQSSDSFTLIGEEPQTSNQNALEELMSIQNELTVTMRKKEKISGKLSQVNRQLDHDLEDRTKELTEYQDKLRSTLLELSLVQDRERKKIANDLHDFLAQLLVTCKLKLNQIDQKTMPPQPSHMLKNVEEIIDQSLLYTRTLISELYPTSLQHLGLFQTLRWLAKDMQRFGLIVSIPEDIPSVQISEHKRIMIYKSVREVLFNVLKHAEVNEASIHWICESECKFLIRITDAGKGFDPHNMDREQEPGHLGLFFYQEQIKSLQGQLDVLSAPDSGTTVTITFENTFTD
ncbi:MAG: hypothetical protein NPIRA01_13670 [Nitrospirales bacterium]|nr:MAG: hypothetical protein NPIRA01_13670 [Nitrospirales bacterium]